ncbi:MAG: tetratricopeptide repeat protein [Paludibacter sp.]
MKKNVFVAISIFAGFLLICWFTFYHHPSTIGAFRNDTIFAKQLCDSAKKVEQSKPDSAIKLYYKAINIIENIPTDAKTNHLLGIFYVNIANVYIPQAQYDSTKRLINKALLVTNNSDKEVEARCYNLKALVCLQLQVFDSAMLYFDRAATIAKQIDNKQILARTISGKAIINCMQGDLKSGLKGFNETMEIGKSIQDDEIINGSCINIGMVYMNLSDYNSALSYFQQAQTHYIKHNLKNDQVMTYNNIGSIYFNTERYSDALDVYHKTLKLALEMNDKKGIAKAYHNLGETYKVIGDYNQAIKYNFKALKIKESISDKAGVAIEYRLLAKLYELQNNKQKTLYYHTQAFKIDSTLSLLPMIANDYANIAVDLEALGDRRKTVEYFQKSYKIYQQTENILGMSEMEKALGETYEQNKEYDKALQFYLKSLETMNQIQGDQEGIASLYITLSRFYANIPISKTESLNTRQLSVDYGLKAYKIAESLKIDYLIADASKSLSDAYKNQSDFKNAYRFLVIQKQANDSIFSKSKAEALIFGEARWSSEKKQQQITILEKLNKAVIAQKEEEAKRHLLTLISLIIIFVLITIVLTLYWLYKHKRREIKFQNQLTSISLLRLQNIRNRISPHFIFNILNREISSEEDKEKHKEMIGLVKFLRRSLEITEQTSVTLAEELDFVKNYLQIEQNSLGDDFQVRWDIDSDLILDQWFIPAMILQIPVENALKHALRAKEGEKRLRISITLNQNRVQILIQDNGDGYHPENIVSTRGTGTGLKVLYQTIDVLNSRNYEKIEFAIGDVKDEATSGTKVEISIPDGYSFEL